MLWAVSLGDRNKLERQGEGAVAPFQPLAPAELILAASTVSNASLLSSPLGQSFQGSIPVLGTGPAVSSSSSAHVSGREG